MINPPSSTKSSPLDRFRANLVSLLWQTSGVFLTFLVMLILTAGKPSSSILLITFLMAGGFVVWVETKREQRFHKQEITAFLPAKQSIEQNSLAQINEPDTFIQIENSVPINYLRSGKIEKWNQWRRYKTKKEAYLRRVNLTEVNLRRTNLTEANLRGVNLRGADLIKADLTKADLIKADLTEAYLIETCFVEANLTEAILGGADLRKANLAEANLRGANLTAALLGGADLRKANLVEANLTGAILVGANIKGAIFTEAILTEAILNRAVVKDAVFGANPGLTDEDRAGLEERGAIFQDFPGDTSDVLVKR